jgi:regulator of cell morphogenesis and NO signaling
MTDLNSKTLAEIVTQNYRTAAVFEKHNLDFCCNGKRTLEQACTDRHIPVEVIVDELTSTMQPTSGSCQVAFPFDKLSPTQLADYIVRVHHAFVRKESGSITAYLQKVVPKHGQRNPELKKIEEAFVTLREEMDAHMRKEELVLFPRIKEIEKLIAEKADPFRLHISYVQAPIDIMEQEHDHAGAIMHEIALISNSYTPPQDACSTYRVLFASLKAFESDLHQHVHLENNILFPKALALYKSAREKMLN